MLLQCFQDQVTFLREHTKQLLRLFNSPIRLLLQPLFLLPSKLQLAKAEVLSKGFALESPIKHVKNWLSIVPALADSCSVVLGTLRTNRLPSIKLTGYSVYNGIVLSHKKEWNNAIYSNMDGPRDHHTKWSKSNKDKYHMIPLICGILKKLYKWTYLQKRNRLTDIENKLMVTKGERDRGGIN